jgi:glycosyltransferase involved in cell wall biosynthesis
VRLGHLAQYPPRPLHLLAWYTDQAAPTPAPCISIVTPTFNQAHFLERTLQSVLAQDYPALEYIVQDGGSTDATPALLNRYRDRLAHVESAPDNGQAHALNRGFARATGEIMAWLNSDDLLLPGALNTVATYFAQHPEVDVVYGHRVVVDERGDEIGRWVLPPHDDKVLRWADYIPQETLFWRRQIWEKSGGTLDENFHFALDWELLLRFQAAGAKMICLPRFLGAFRVHTLQKTSVQLDDLGAKEMARLRQRCHGRAVSQAEIGRGIGPYLARSVVYHSLYQWGLRRY